MRSRSFVFLFAAVFALACKKPAPRTDAAPQPRSSDAAPASPPPVIILLDAAPPDSAEAAAAMTLVRRWNEAQVSGDAQTLSSFFAPKLLVNGVTVSAPDHVKRTMENADVQQSITAVSAETTADEKETYVHFKKVLGKDDAKTETPMLVIVREGLIVEESEDSPTWCLNKDKTTNGKTQPGMKLSASAAVAAAKDSKHFAELKKRVPHLGADLFGFGCAKRCAIPKRECGYHFRMSDVDDDAKVVEWVYVDPVNKVLWWQEKDWMSEQLRL